MALAPPAPSPHPTLPHPCLQPGTQVVVHGLPFKFSWQDLKDLAR